MDVDRRVGPNDALETMRDDARQSADSIGIKLGRARTWFGNIRGRDPHLSTVAAVASVTGHEIAILDSESGEIVATIETPERPNHKAKAKTSNQDVQDRET